MLATKAACDNETLPWISRNGGRRRESELMAMMSDFVDSATADAGIEWSRSRLG